MVSICILGWAKVHTEERGESKEDFGKFYASLFFFLSSLAIHAFALQTFFAKGKDKVRFKVHPYQRDSHTTVASEAEVLEEREVRNSGGRQYAIAFWWIRENHTY